MKTTRLKVVGAIFIAMMALIGFGAASNTGDTVLEGNIGDVFELTVPTAVTWTATPGQTMSEEIDLNLTSNNFPWSVKVRSDGPDGKMREFDGVNYVANPKSLKNPMHIAYGSIDVTLINEDQDLISDEVTIGTDMLYRVELSQLIDATDTGLFSGHVYQIVVAFTGGIQY
ncbi:MAG: hypothetical protein NTY37_11260 [Methanothrix sp.]|nr:hypothetical protein [Methanothrix sp.]